MIVDECRARIRAGASPRLHLRSICHVEKRSRAIAAHLVSSTAGQATIDIRRTGLTVGIQGQPGVQQKKIGKLLTPKPTRKRGKQSRTKAARRRSGCSAQRDSR